MGPGYNNMNDLVILQTTQGIIQYLYSITISSAEYFRKQVIFHLNLLIITDDAI
jgi:hypothetical protein